MKELRALIDRGMSYQDIMDALAAMRHEDRERDAKLNEARAGVVEALVAYMEALFPDETVDSDFQKYMYHELKKTEEAMRDMEQILPTELFSSKIALKPAKVSVKTGTVSNDEDTLENFLKSLGIKEEH